MGGDTLTCGVCSKDFALADIVKFIQHKVLTCNKENYCKKSGTATENGKENGDTDDDPKEAAESESTNNNNNKETTNSLSSPSTPTAPSATDKVTSSPPQRRHSTGSSSPGSAGGKSPHSTSSEPVGVIPMGCDLLGDANNHKLDKLKSESEESRKRKADCVDADTNTIITGKSFTEQEWCKRSCGYFLQGPSWSCILQG